MRLHVTATDTGESQIYDDEGERITTSSRFLQFLGNTLATLPVSDTDGTGPAVIIRWIPDEEN